jgi:hypothetical protein
VVDAVAVSHLLAGSDVALGHVHNLERTIYNIRVRYNNLKTVENKS